MLRLHWKVQVRMSTSIFWFVYFLNKNSTVLLSVVKNNVIRVLTTSKPKKLLKLSRKTHVGRQLLCVTAKPQKNYISNQRCKHWLRYCVKAKKHPS